MPDGTTSMLMSAFHSALDGLKFVWVALMGLIVWNGKRLVKKVDDLEKTSISSDTFNDTLSSLRHDIHSLGETQAGQHKAMRSDTREDIKGVHSRIDKLMEK